ncbi:MAG: hypothetical protein WCY07_05520 [Pigmentiphaga sp.]
MSDIENLKGQITALQNVLSMLISATPNADQLRSVIQAVADQVAPTLDETHPSFKAGWQNTIKNLCQTSGGEDAPEAH